MMPDLHVLSWNITRRCNLSCSHCYLPAVTGAESAGCSLSSELSTEEALGVIDGIAAVNSEVMLILSGGEPLLRPDLFDLASRATAKGMMVVVGSNGLLIDKAAARRLRKSGVTGISISLDSTTPDLHDAVRSCPGAWERTVAAIQACVDEDLSVQINTVVTKKNHDQLPALMTLSRHLGATVFSPFFLVCTGRGEEMTDITPHQYEQVLSLIVESQGKFGDLMIRTRCAPTVRRILYERNPASSLLKMGTGRCMAGQSYCRISPEGDVTPCPYMPLAAGNVRQQDFKYIWDRADVFKALRRPALKGKCKDCEYRQLCGGCRARAYASHYDPLAEDPWCEYRSRGGAMIQPPTFEQESSVATIEATQPVWTKEAEDRLKRVPFFVRGMVRSAVERYARDRQCAEITPVIMEELKQKSGMGGMHGHR